jgi:hypothetical protein
MKKLGERNYALISDAVKMTGTYDPIQTLCAFEEECYVDEIATIKTFLGWVHENGKTFGHGNYEEVFTEFLSDTKPVCRNCKWYNFKVDGGDGAYGECLNKKVDHYISLRGDIGNFVKGETTNEGADNFNNVVNTMHKHSNVWFNEDTFGCIHFEKQK